MMRRSLALVLMAAATTGFLIHHHARSMLTDSAINHDADRTKRYFERSIKSDAKAVALDEKRILSAVHDRVK
jgi:hypothetical protein